MASKWQLRRGIHLHFWEVSLDGSEGYAGSLWSKVGVGWPKEWTEIGKLSKAELWNGPASEPRQKLWDSNLPWTCKMSWCQVTRKFQEWNNDKQIRQNDTREMVMFCHLSDNDYLVSNYFCGKMEVKAMLKGMRINWIQRLFYNSFTQITEAYPFSFHFFYQPHYSFTLFILSVIKVVSCSISSEFCDSYI